MWRPVDAIGNALMEKQLGFILVVLIICICIFAPSRLQKEEEVRLTGQHLDPTAALEECPTIPPNYDQVWSWCHGSRYKVCKANYPYEQKIEDVELILRHMTRYGVGCRY